MHEGKQTLIRALVAMTSCIDDHEILKSLNLSILMHTRSEDTRLRIYALACAVGIWQEHGKKLSSPYFFSTKQNEYNRTESNTQTKTPTGFGPETAAFITECAEDENDDVVRECHKLKNAVEAETGKIEGL